jgi:small subunit ribosomal protein S20
LWYSKIKASARNFAFFVLHFAFDRAERGNVAITKSAKKALRQGLKRGIRNLAFKNKMKNLIKKAKGLVSQKKIEEAKKLLPQVYKILDKAAKVGLIKKNTAARKKSRITKLLSLKIKT